MNRQETIQSLLQYMEVVGKAMISRKAQQVQADMPTRAQLGILVIVLYQGPQSIKSLANNFCMTSSAATQLVNGLVKDGLLTRVEDKKDRRKICLEMTQKGKRSLVLAKKEREKTMLQIFEPLTDAELRQLEQIQRKITQHVQRLWTKNQAAK